MPTIPTYELRNAISKNRFKGLWRLMVGFHLPYLGANGTLAMAALFKTSTYLLLRYFVDNVLSSVSPGKQQIPNLVLWIGVGFVFLAVFEGTFTFLSGRLAAYTAEGIALRMRNYLFDHIQRLSFAYHSKTQTGELIQRATSDVDAVRRFFSEQAIGIGRIILLFLINFIAIYRLNSFLALISIIAVPFIFVASIFFFRRITTAYEKYQEQEATLTTTLQENLTGVRVVKAFARQNYERDKFENVNWEKYRRGKRLLVMHALFWPVTDIICGFQMLGGFLAGAILAIDGTITVGTYMAYAGLVVWLIWPMRNLGRLIVQTSTGLVSFGRVMEIVRQEREPLTEGNYQPQKDVTGEIIFQNVSFEYEDSDNSILEDISFECKPGQVVAMLGGTGSGKTSLVNLLPRFHEYSGGSITIDGIELKQYPRQYLRRQIGIVEQEPFLFSRTIR